MGVVVDPDSIPKALYRDTGDPFHYVRLERIKAPDPSRPVLVSLPGQDGRVEDLSWDEESGRICVIFSPFGDRSTRNMLMVDLI